jgi:hypothetical protein
LHGQIIEGTGKKGSFACFKIDERTITTGILAIEEVLVSASRGEYAIALYIGDANIDLTTITKQTAEIFDSAKPTE